MCLIAIAHRASPRWPLVIAANRDEFFARPARAAHWWDDAADVLGGRDLRAGGSWLAFTRSGRFAMVTNVRGTRPADGSGPPPSRGLLVSDFVRGAERPMAFASRVARESYEGFHLVCGEVGGTAAHVGSDDPARMLEPGVFAVSNAPAHADWPKVVDARAMMEQALERDDLEAELMQFLTTPRGLPIESEVFVSLPEIGYGTRASTVVIASAAGAIDFIERTAEGAARFRLRSPS